MGAGWPGSGVPSLPSTLSSWPYSPSSEGQSVRHSRPAALATCPKFRCPARELRLPPPPGLLQLVPPGRPSPSALPAAVGAAAAPARGRRLRCHRAPRRALGLPRSLRTHFPPRPAEGSIRPLRPRPVPPPVGLPRRPLGSVVLAGLAGICSLTWWVPGLCRYRDWGLGV